MAELSLDHDRTLPRQKSLREQGSQAEGSDTRLTSKTKEMIMTKYMKILFVGALSVAVAHPALAHCGSSHAKTSRAAVAPKKPAVAGLRTAPTDQPGTAEAVPSGLSSELLGG